MDVGAYIICIVKTNKKLFCNDTADKIKNDWPEGYYLVSKKKYTMNGDRLIIDTGCKYNYQKVIYLIAT